MLAPGVLGDTGLRVPRCDGIADTVAEMRAQMPRRGIHKAGRSDDVRSNTMAMETQIRRLRARVARAADSLIWYYRTRPDAWRYLAAPGLGAFLTLWLSVAWGLLGPLLALVVVGSFAVFAIQLVEELRSLEAEAKASIELEAGDVPWLAGLTEEESSQPSTEARAPEAEGPSELDLPGLPTLELG